MFLFFVGVTALLVQPALAKDKTSDIAPQALKIVDRATSFLAKQKQFSVSVEIWDDFVSAENRNVQFSKTVELNLRRPDQFRIQTATMQPEKSFFYNGKSVTYLDQRTGFFGIAAAPATIDKTIAAMGNKYDISFPLDDMLLSTPFGGSAEKASSGQYYGVEMMSGIPCHHLAFQHDLIDWQVWVEDGLLPVVRKIVIIHKAEQGSPQFTAMFDKWDFSTALPDYLFNFEPSPDYRKIDIIETVQDKTSVQE